LTDATGDAGQLGTTASAGTSRRQRLLLAGAGFLAFEAIFIWILGDRIYDFSYLSPVLWGMLALAGAGYFALGFFSRSWLSALFLVGPLLVAVYFVNVVWTHDLPNGGMVTDNASFAEIWLELSLLFIPAWGAGLIYGKRRARQI